jgi:hypothetical protein
MAEEIVYESRPSGPPLAFGDADRLTVRISTEHASFGTASYPIAGITLAYLTQTKVPARLGCLLGLGTVWLANEFAETTVWLEMDGQDHPVYRCRDLAEGKAVLLALETARHHNLHV